MTSSDEGLIFTDPRTVTDGHVKKWFTDNFPFAPVAALTRLTSLYPIPLMSSWRYLTEFDRLKNIIGGKFHLNRYLIPRFHSNLQRLIPRPSFWFNLLQLPVLNSPRNPRP